MRRLLLISLLSGALILSLPASSALAGGGHKEKAQNHREQVRENRKERRKTTSEKRKERKAKRERAKERKKGYRDARKAKGRSDGNHDDHDDHSGHDHGKAQENASDMISSNIIP